MKLKSLVIALFFKLLMLNGSVILAQITAGSIPPGMSATNPNINLNVSTCDAYDSTFFDIDCDGMSDMIAILYKGYTSFDIYNLAVLSVLNSDFEICRDTGGNSLIPIYFSQGDSLECPSNAIWASDATYMLGNYGCMACLGPFNQIDKFIAYNYLGEVGWMKFSFSLIDLGNCNTPITFSSSSILSPCINASLNSLSSQDNFSISPNPFNSHTLISSDYFLNGFSITIFNAMGSKVKNLENFSGTKMILEREVLPEGIYIIYISNDKTVISKKVIISD